MDEINMYASITENESFKLLENFIDQYWQMLALILFAVCGVHIRIVYVISAKQQGPDSKNPSVRQRSRIPHGSRILLVNILISHLGTIISGVSHLVLDEIEKQLSRKAAEQQYDIRSRIRHTVTISSDIEPRPGIALHALINETTAETACYVLSIMEYIFFTANCMLIALHAFVRCHSVCRYVHHQEFFSPTRLKYLSASIWAVAVVLGIIGIIHLGAYFVTISVSGLLLSITTIVIYIYTFVYWKRVLKPDEILHSHNRNSVDPALLRAAITSFALSSADIFGNSLSLCALFLQQKMQDDITAQDFPLKKQMVDVAQTTSQLREILFLILFFSVFGENQRRLFLGRRLTVKRTTNTTSSSNPAARQAIHRDSGADHSMQLTTFSHSHSSPRNSVQVTIRERTLEREVPLLSVEPCAEPSAVVPEQDTVGNMLDAEPIAMNVVTVTVTTVDRELSTVDVVPSPAGPIPIIVDV